MSASRLCPVEKAQQAQRPNRAVSPQPQRTAVTCHEQSALCTQRKTEAKWQLTSAEGADHCQTDEGTSNLCLGGGLRRDGDIYKKIFCLKGQLTHITREKKSLWCCVAMQIASVL